MKNTLRITFTAVVLVCVTMFVMIGTAKEKKQKPHATLIGKQAPAWALKAAVNEKTKTKLADYKGKWVLMEFWFPG
jgi:uncharacterized ion transporter superfamily protein YfcC